MQGLLILIALLGALCALLLVLSFNRLRKRKWLAGMGLGGQAMLFLLLFAVVLLLYSNLHTYHRLTHESVLADVYLRQIKPQRFQLSLELPGQPEAQHYYLIEGDQWQLDARILKWKGWANLIGLDSHFQLQRLSGRFSDIAQARRQIPSIHDLSSPPRGLDLWKLKQLFRERLVFIDTLFGQSVFMPMRDGAHYRISVGQSGLIVRPINEAASSAVK